MRERYQKQLLQLNEDLITMGALCESAISSAVKGFIDVDAAMATKAFEIEKEINEKEKEIEAKCIKLLLQQQPVASDLRFISAALKMITDLERIGDHAVDIAELYEYASGGLALVDIKKMAVEAVRMVTLSIDAYVKRDLELANKVVEYDDIVDQLFDTVKNDIIEEIKQGVNDPLGSIDLIMIAKYLERIGDHATNIAEWVVFSVTGKHEEE